MKEARTKYQPKSERSLFVILGLGNPGQRYELSRHNIGFLLLDHFTDHFGFSMNSNKFNCQMGEVTLEDQKVVFAKPQTYMNKSGEAAQAFMDFFKLPADHMVVCHDEIDLAFGDVRLKSRGGTAGHNGVESVFQHLGTDAFHRIRLGIGRPVDARIDVADYVLSPFTDEERKGLPTAFQRATEIIEKLLAGP